MKRLIPTSLACYGDVLMGTLVFACAYCQSLLPNPDMSWTSDIEPLLEYYTERTPGAVKEVSSVRDSFVFSCLFVVFFLPFSFFYRYPLSPPLLLPSFCQTYSLKTFSTGILLLTPLELDTIFLY